MRPARVKTFDVRIEGELFAVDAFDWRSAQVAAQKRYGDRHGRRPPFVLKSSVVKRRRVAVSA